MASNTLSSDQIREYKRILNEYVPYSQEEINAIELDSKDYDFWRMRAFIAKKALDQAGLLDD